MIDALDSFDQKIVAALADDGRLTVAEVAARVGLSPSACTRRIQNLERTGVISGYRALIEPARIGLGVSIFVEITLERQSSDTLRAFEDGLRRCPNVVTCHLMSGTSDYLVHLIAPDLEGFERLHAETLGQLPGVSRIESKFSLRRVVDRPVAPIT
ncbi:MAG: Lrp/AsnC family transcriptional regulator [Alphaproteobacteria bacterium]